MKHQSYTLPDNILLEKAIEILKDHQGLVEPYFAHTEFVPLEACLVIGQSNQREHSIDLPLAELDAIPVIQRPSGGEAVFLSPRTMVISLVVVAGKIIKSVEAFHQILSMILDALAAQGCTEAVHRGISDLAIQDKKILGCSIYRRPNLLFYHAVLNLSESPAVISRYLLHPGREPDYRKNRNHAEFVTSLTQCGYAIDIPKFRADLAESYQKHWHKMVV